MTHTSTEQPEALPTPDAVIEQAQVFASAWSLYGHSEEAATEEALLTDMVRRLHARIAELKAERDDLKTRLEAALRCVEHLEASQAQRVALSNQDAETLVQDCDYNPHLVLRTMERRFGITQEKQGCVEALTRCAADCDGNCTHAQCPQLRDNEPHSTGRHCPLDIDEDDL